MFSLRTKYRFALVALVAACTSTTALATVSSAKRGLFWGTVTVTGKAVNTPYHIWQETAPGSGTYVDTGYTVTTGAGGAGSGDIPNVASGTLLTGRNVKIGTAAGPNAQAGAVVSRTFAAWLLTSANPGNNNANIQLANFDNTGSDTFRQSFDPGTQFALSMNTSIARFANLGIAVSAPGVVFSAPVVSDGQIAFGVISNSAPNSDQTITLSGVALNAVGPIGSVFDLFFSATGTTNTYVNGSLASSGSFSAATTLSPVQTLEIVPAPGAIVAAGVAMAVGSRRRRR
jgi:hypothetical protein